MQWLGGSLDALDAGPPWRADAAFAQVVALADVPGGRRAVITVLGELLAAQVDRAWSLGWQPADLHRLAGRRLDSAAQLILADAIATQLSQYAPATIAPRWAGQLHEMGATVWWPAATDALDARAGSHAAGLAPVVAGAIRTAHLLMRLPRLECHDPLPGTARPGQRRASGADDERILERVRALLAKAESTTFEAEAETFTAGAQALMARHSIDAAMVAAGSTVTGTGPQARRIGIDRPYEGPKVLLLDVVARANRCRSIWTKDLGFVTLVGFESDVQAAETIFTSLLVQAGRAVAAHGTRKTGFGTSRTRAFRQSFLASYAQRIGERLRAVTAEETEAAVNRASTLHVAGRELVRVLDARSGAVDDAMASLFPATVQRAVGPANDAEGWQAGRRAADQARLSGAGAELTG